MFVKPERVDLPNRQYYGYEMDSDELLIGYGLPWHDQQRNLLCVAKLKTQQR